jgi:hypothetical protein
MPLGRRPCSRSSLLIASSLGPGTPRIPCWGKRPLTCAPVVIDVESQRIHDVPKAFHEDGIRQ